ncbi:hypothetical protein KDW_18760 [Dictyobacter vulcani]|uniref:Uncharacterized protein n=1 Tax=Dictyobacter vulcani TaxID=2607529 RepID=A0A5J4KEL8_9CHLR|nr:hypothetical protein [Dictyobacter vulcani]GER87714.1 hypothetical protein KDW_18760 [Dictyobacter vulcani]
MARDQKAKNKARQTTAKAPEAGVQPAPQTVEETPRATSVAVAAPQERPVVAAVPQNWPSWPTSKPGPTSMPAPAGMRPFNRVRREQVTEIGYNQETGEPSDSSPMRPMPDPDLKDAVSFDQKPTGQDTLGKRKKRL